MSSFGTSYQRSQGRAHRVFGQLRSRVDSCSALWTLFFVLLVISSPHACSSARFSPRSTAQLKSAVANCARHLPKCSIAGWDVSNVRHMSGMFRGALSFDRDISSWHVSKVVSMKNMFRNAASFKHSLCGTRWVHSQAIKTDMFLGSSGSISRTVCAHKACMSTTPEKRSWWPYSDDTDAKSTAPPTPGVTKPAVTKFSSKKDLKRAVDAYLKLRVMDEGGVYILSDRSATKKDSPETNIGDWDVSGVTDMSGLFAGEFFNEDISKWDVSRVTDMSGMFQFAQTGQAVQQFTMSGMFNGDLSKWDVSSVTDMSSMFKGAFGFNGDISKWDVSSVTDTSHMFEGAASFNQDLSRWDVSRVTDMKRMFYDASSFNGDISKWDVSSVEDMTETFRDAKAFDGHMSDFSEPSDFSGDPNRKRIVIGGGTGFVGKALASSLRSKGHDVIVVTRKPISWENIMTWEDIERNGLPNNIDAVINLAGSNIFDFKQVWGCGGYKEECVESRVSTTQLLANAILESEQPPSVWISTSGVGFYPPSTRAEYDEQSVVLDTSRDWASQLYASVEAAAALPQPTTAFPPIADFPGVPSTRSVVMRLGMVLGEGGGAYEYMKMPFYMCLGSTLGDGSQWFPYVHLNDAVRAYEFALFDPRAQGPLNVVAPSLCTNKVFANNLGVKMAKPRLFSVPSFVSSLMGEERGAMLFKGQRVKPAALTSLGFEFQCPDVTSCCEKLVAEKKK